MSTLFRLLLLALAMALPRVASATIFNNRVCAEVDIAFDDADWGTRWTDDGPNKPGRGFWVEVKHGTFPNVVVDWPPAGSDNYVETTGSFAGCTDDIAFDSTITYTIVVKSEAKIDDVTLVALDDSNPPVRATYTWNSYVPAVDQDVNIALSGLGDARWNVLALDAYALVLHNPTSGALTWELRMRDCPGQIGGSCASEVNQNVSYTANHRYDKFVVVHELGHLVSYAADGGGLGCNGSTQASENNCDGSGVAQNGHGILTKEFQGAAACEGIADFYAAITMNALTDPCELADGSLDFNLDTINDFDNNEGFPCYGDPFNGSPDPVTDGDWLEDLVNANDDWDLDGIQCDGTLTHRSTEHDWVRYLWGMVTTEGVPLTDLWEIWDAADPYSWEGAGSGATGTFPNERMETAADSHPQNYATEHDNQKVHGLDH